jgi:phosphatidylglycerol:prolipoprotein diacylglycerol transferase
VYLPYIDIPDGHIGPIPLHPFGVLVATGVLVGSHLAVRRCPRFGLDRKKMESLITWFLVTGFICAHVLDELMYRPKEALEHPASLLMIWQGIGSFSGWIGATIGAVAWKYKHKEKILPYMEQVAAVFPIAWVFGRTGCSVAHDHIGRLSQSPLAVKFPEGYPYHGATRFDLGLLEMLITIPIAIGIYIFAQKKRPNGAIIGVLSVVYAPIRFGLDSLRATDIREPDARYLGLTPGQWMSVALLVWGVGLLVWVYRKPRAPEAPRSSGDDEAHASTT